MFSTIRSKLIVSFSMLAIITAGIVGATYWFTQQNNQLVAQAIDRDFKGSSVISGLALDAQKIRRYEKEYFMYVGDEEKKTKYQNEWRQTYNKLSDQLQSMRNDRTGVWSAADLANIKAWSESLRAYGEGFEQVIEDVNRGLLTNTLSANAAIQDGKNAFRVMLDGTAAASAQKLVAAQQAEQTILVSSTRLNQILVGLLVLSLVLILLVMNIVPRAIIRPIQTLSKAAEDMSKGELEKSVPTELSIRDFDSLAQTLERLRISQKTLMARYYRKAETKSAA